MKEIPILNRNGAIVAYARVDDADFDDLTAHTWRLNSSGYAVRGKVIEGRMTVIAMHRVILGSRPDAKAKADHIDRDRLNNVRTNLRWCSDTENILNRNMQRNNTSGYRGVSWKTRKQQWRVEIEHQGKAYHVGYYRSAIDAALAYDAAAKRLHGSFARLNFPATQPAVRAAS